MMESLQGNKITINKYKNSYFCKQEQQTHTHTNIIKKKS